MQRLRVAGLLVCILVAAACGAAIAADKEERRPAAPPDWAPGFSLSYRCTDARDQLEATDVGYRLTYRGERWLAQISLTVEAATLRRGCDVAFSMPRDSRDAGVEPPAGHRGISLEREGSPESGAATVHVRPADRGDGARSYALAVVLPAHYDMSRSLGIGRHLFKFDFFGAGEAGSFQTGTVEVTVPEGYSLVDASPGGVGGRAPVRSRAWTWRTARDFEAVVTFQEDRLRQAMDLAPEALLGAGAAFLALLALPARRRDEPAPEQAEVPARRASPPSPPPAPPRPDVARPRRPTRRRRYLWLGLLAIPLVRRLLRRGR